LQDLIPAQDLNRERSSLLLRGRICLFGTHALAFIIIIQVWDKRSNLLLFKQAG
jgi:hypothetical protein